MLFPSASASVPAARDVPRDSYTASSGEAATAARGWATTISAITMVRRTRLVLTITPRVGSLGIHTSATPPDMGLCPDLPHAINSGSRSVADSRELGTCEACR